MQECGRVYLLVYSFKIPVDTVLCKNLSLLNLFNLCPNSIFNKLDLHNSSFYSGQEVSTLQHTPGWSKIRAKLKVGRGGGGKDEGENVRGKRVRAKLKGGQV